jgi:PAS domain S-box-containing protein
VAAAENIGELERLRATCLELRQRVNELEANVDFRAGFEQSAVAQAMTSLDGRLLRVNDAFANLLGYSPNELVGKQFQEITHPDDRATSATAHDALLAGSMVRKHSPTSSRAKHVSLAPRLFS